METPVEKYCLHYTYLGNIRNGTPDSAQSFDDELEAFVKAEIEIYENLTKTMEILSPLPEMYCLQISLQYNSDAPPNYAAPSFTNSIQILPKIVNGVTMRHLQNFQTQWNRLDIYSKYSKKFHCDLNQFKKSASDEVIVNCFCLKKLCRDLFAVIRCSNCNGFSHSICYGILEKKYELICVDCAFNNMGLDCCDTALLKLTEEKRLLVSLIRLSLFYFLGSNVTTADELRINLEIDDDLMLKKLLQYLVALKVIKLQSDG